MLFTVIGVASTLSTIGESRVMLLAPAASPENVNVASTPDPAGPAGVAPRLAQPKRSVPVPGRNWGQETVRPVLPRKPESVTETKEISAGFQFRPIS